MTNTTLNRAAQAAEAGRDPEETYDAEHGAYQGDGSEDASEDEKWGGGLNPVRDKPLAAKNLRAVGGG